MVFLHSLFYGKQRASKVWTGFGSDRLKKAGSFVPDLRIAAHISKQVGASIFSKVKTTDTWGQKLAEHSCGSPALLLNADPAVEIILRHH